MMSEYKFPEKLYKELLKCSEDNLNSLIRDDEIDIYDETYDVFNEFLDQLILFVRHNDEKCLNEFKTKEKQDKFWSYIEGIINNISNSYNDSEFVRNMKYDEYERYSKEIFEKYILYNDNIKALDTLSEDEVWVLIKIFNISKRQIVELRFSFDEFFHNQFMMFELPKEKSEIIWNLINHNKCAIREDIIISKLNKLCSLLDE